MKKQLLITAFVVSGLVILTIIFFVVSNWDKIFTERNETGNTVLEEITNVFNSLKVDDNADTEIANESGENSIETEEDTAEKDNDLGLGYKTHKEDNIEITYPDSWNLITDYNKVVDLGMFRLENNKYKVSYTERSDVPYICLFSDTTEEQKNAFIEYFKEFGASQMEIDYLAGNINEGAFKQFNLKNGEGTLRLYKSENPEVDDNIWSSCYKSKNRTYFQDFPLSVSFESDSTVDSELKFVLESIVVGYGAIY